METDERFKHLATDPRFKTLRKKQHKVQIDERFQSMFTDDRFTLKYSKDKRGRNQKKTSGDDLKRYYSLEERVKEPTKEITKKNKEEEEVVESSRYEEDDGDDDSKDEEGAEEPGPANSEEEEDEEEQDFEDEDTPESEFSSSSDESESEVEEDTQGNEVDIDKIEFNWQPLDHDAETADVSTKRLAIQNLDWDRLDVKDLYTLVNSVRPPTVVRIYVSEFGKERLKEEELHGPKEIVEMPNLDDEEEEEYKLLEGKMKALENPKPKAQRVHEYEDADDELDPKNQEIRERIRRYQLSRMKYYYAVAEFDSIESAELVYKELDGMEYEGSSLELDLRFIPDDIEFDEADLKAECNKLPDLTTYKAPQFISTALQQTTVKFTWDETDIKRQEKLHKAYTKEELEKDDLEAYLASETDTEEDEDEDEVENFNDTLSVVTANSEARVNKYKQLLKSLEEEENRKKKIDVDVEWGNFSEDEQKQEFDSADDEEEEEGEAVNWDDNEGSSLGSSDIDEEEEKSMRGVEGKRERNRRRKAEEEKLDKKVKRKGKKEKKRGDDNVDGDNELDLLVMDTSERRNEFKFNPDDDRFKAVYESGLYNIDPSHPNFKRTQAFDLMAEKKREKRRKTSSR